MSDLDIIFACSDAGIHVDGSREGALNLYNNVDYNNKIKIVQKDFVKNKNVDNKEKNLKEVNSFNKQLYDKAINILNKDHKLLTIGGDHSIVIASALAGVKKYEKMGIIWIDAHGDYNTFDTTITGNLHGLPLAVIDGYEKRKLMEFHNGNNISPKNTVIIGGRDFDKNELDNLNDAGVKIFSIEDIRSIGIKKVIKEAFKIASMNTNCVHVSYDIDVIDPLLAPGVSIPAINGINVEEAYQIMDELLKYKNMINTFDIVEYNSLRDKDNITYNITMKLINTVISKLL